MHAIFGRKASQEAGGAGEIALFWEAEGGLCIMGSSRRIVNGEHGGKSRPYRRICD